MLFGLTYSTVLTIHIGSFLWNITLVVISDLFAGLWVLGKIKILPQTTMQRLHYLIVCGLVVSIGSGALLFSTVSSYLLEQPAFITKVLLVATLIVNAFLIHRHIPTATNRPFADVSRTERLPLLASGVLSTACWIGVIISSQFLGL